MSTQAGEPPDLGTLRRHLRRFRGGAAGFRWDDVPLKHYKHEGTHFKDITRQTLFGEEDGPPCELRYFEIAPGGHSTFERHDHTHAVVILRGEGRVIVGEEIADVEALDLVHVPPQTWHQLQADDDVPLGFLCLVPCERDRPSRPTDEERAALRADPFFGALARL
jgi:quercetin dioxygenase-like cupin family protein